MAVVGEWGLFTLVVLAFAALLLLPGYLAARLAGQRGILAWAIAPALTLTATTAAAVGAAWARVNYGLWVVAAAALMLAIVALPLRLLTRWQGTRASDGETRRWVRRSAGETRQWARRSAGEIPARTRERARRAAPESPAAVAGWGILIGTVVALVTIVRLAITMGHPWAPSQTYDGLYHLNALAMMRDTGSASPFTMDLYDPGATSFYPNAWHQVAILLAGVVGDLPTVTNALAAAVMVVIWPITLAAVLWTISGHHRALTLTGVALSQTIPQFPQMFFTFGSLYPNLLGFVSAVGVLALGIDVLYRRTFPAAVAGSILILLALPGVGMAHPTAVIVLAMVAAIMVAARLATAVFNWARALRGRATGEERPATPEAELKRPASPDAALVRPASRDAVFPRLAWWRGLGADVAHLALAGLIALALILGIYLVAGRFPMLAGMQQVDPSGWLPGSSGRIVALIKAGTLAVGTWFSHGVYFSVLLGVIAVIGGWVAGRNRAWQGLVLFHLLTVFLYVIADGDWNLERRAWLTGFFYVDPNRMAALVGLSAALLLPFGTLAIARMVRRPVLVGALVAIIAQVSPSFFFLGHYTQQAYLLPESEAGSIGMLTMDEYELLSRLDETIPQGDTVLGNPWTGTAYAWTLADRRTLYPNLSGYSAPDRVFLATSANTLAREPDGCEAVRANRAYWVLDFGPEYLWDGDDPARRYRYYYGFEKLPESQVASVADSQGRARLLHIDVCGDDQR